MSEKQINEWLLTEESVKCAFGDHSNHTHPDSEETIENEPEVSGEENN